MLPACTWTANTSLGSDHIPLHIKLSKTIKKTPAPKRTFINFKKADWQSFENYTEEIFETAPHNSNIHASEKFLRNIINNAAKKFTPRGRIPKIINAMPTETVRLIEERDQLRKTNPADAKIKELNLEINNATNAHRKQKWTDHLATCGQGTKKLWDTIKSINNPAKQPENLSIKCDKKTL